MAEKKIRRNYLNAAGQKLPGVTSIMSEHLGWKTNGLIGWAFKLGQEGRSLKERDDAAALGTLAHSFFEQMHGGGPVDCGSFTESEIEAAKALAHKGQTMLDAHDLEVVHSELQLVGGKAPYEFGGTLDVLCKHKKTSELVIADIKTSKGIYPEMAIQLGAYCILLDDAGHGWPTSGLILHLPYGGESAAVPLTGEHLRAGAMIFTHLLGIHELRGKVGFV